MKNLISNAKTSLKRFHEDEQGDAMQTVMIIAVAAMVVVAIIAFGNKFVGWAGDTSSTMIDTPIDSPD